MNYLDILYSQYFSQLLRYFATPTYVEKRVLDEHVDVIRCYLLQYIDVLEKKVDDYKTKADASYVVWNRKFYEDQVRSRHESIELFKKKLSETKSHEFLKKFESVSEDLESAYPNHLPKSKVRNNLYIAYKMIRKNHTK